MSAKFPNFLNWTSLNNLRKKMEAALTNDFVLPPTFSEKSIFEENLKNNGVNVDFEEVENHDDGTLKYRDYRVLLHIRDIIIPVNGIKRLPRYHLAFCRTLERMKNESKFQRYVVSQATSGEFPINIINNNCITPKKEELNVCQNCLLKIEWEGFNNSMSYEEKKQIVENFSLTDFFEKYPRDLIKRKPLYTAINAPINNYPKNWKAISERFWQLHNYTCNSCGIYLPGPTAKFLHVHHHNGQKYDNRQSNLEAVCIRCHANKPDHAHMKDSPDYKTFISNYK